METVETWNRIYQYVLHLGYDFNGKAHYNNILDCQTVECTFMNSRPKEELTPNRDLPNGCFGKTIVEIKRFYLCDQ